MQLCRVDVHPCQRVFNLPVDGEVDLGLYLQVPDSQEFSEGLLVAGWQLLADVEGDGAVRFIERRGQPGPFRERGHTGLVLEKRNPASSGSPSLEGNSTYYSVLNSYDDEEGVLEYAVALLAVTSGVDSEARLLVSPGERVLLGLLTAHATREGAVSILPSRSRPAAVSVVAVDAEGHLVPRAAGSQETLVEFRVGGAGKGILLEGVARSDRLTTRGTPAIYRRPFRVEIWPNGAIPPWRGGSGVPLAIFSNLKAGRSGEFQVADVAQSLVPNGVYDIRVKGSDTLSILKGSVSIEGPKEGGTRSTEVIVLDLAPLPLGDLNGDNRVDDDDLALLRYDFGNLATNGDDEFSPDLNYDGVVDAQDFSLMAANHGLTGE